MSIFKWLNEQENVNLPQVNVKAVWITTCLDPLNYLWVNYYRFFVYSMDMCTTSFGEALHWSMKVECDWRDRWM